MLILSTVKFVLKTFYEILTEEIRNSNGPYSTKQKFSVTKFKRQCFLIPYLLPFHSRNIEGNYILRLFLHNK